MAFTTHLPPTPIGEYFHTHTHTIGNHFKPSKRGRKRILNDSEVEQVQDAALKLRQAPNAEALTSASVAAIARGVVQRTRPAVLKKNGGVHQMEASWAKYHLNKDQWRPLCAMSGNMTGMQGGVNAIVSLSLPPSLPLRCNPTPTPI